MKNRQNGFTLIELMIGMTIALIVLAGAGGLFVKTLQTNSRNLIVQKADQTIRTITEVMTAEIRRAGYVNLATQETAEVDVATAGCITFEHYSPAPADTTVNHYYGYRLVNGVVYMRTDAATGTCTGVITSGWVSVTDSSMAFEALTFTLDNATKNLTIKGSVWVKNVSTADNQKVIRKLESIVHVRNI